MAKSCCCVACVISVLVAVAVVAGVNNILRQPFAAGQHRVGVVKNWLQRALSKKKMLQLMLQQLQHAAGRLPSCRYISHLLRIETFSFGNLIISLGKKEGAATCEMKLSVKFMWHSQRLSLTGKLGRRTAPPRPVCYLQLRSTCAREFCYFASVRLPDLGHPLQSHTLLPCCQPISLERGWHMNECRTYVCSHTRSHTHTS